MANKTENFLDLNSVNSLLPSNLKIEIENPIERSVYKTIEGKPLPIINSKLYPEGFYWYSCITKYFKNIGAEYICFTAGFSGILIIPIDVVLNYNKFSGWKGESKKGRQYHVRIKPDKEGKLHFWNFNDPKENIDLSLYFIKI